MTNEINESLNVEKNLYEMVSDDMYELVNEDIYEIVGENIYEIVEDYIPETTNVQNYNETIPVPTIRVEKTGYRRGNYKETIPVATIRVEKTDYRRGNTRIIGQPVTRVKVPDQVLQQPPEQAHFHVAQQSLEEIASEAPEEVAHEVAEDVRAQAPIQVPEDPGFNEKMPVCFLISIVVSVCYFRSQ